MGPRMGGLDYIEVFAPQYGIGKSRPNLKRPASALPVAELVLKEWSHHVVKRTTKHAIVRFTSPDGSAYEMRTILLGMLPDPIPGVRNGRSVLHLGETAHAGLNHGTGTKGGGHQDRKKV